MTSKFEDSSEVFRCACGHLNHMVVCNVYSFDEPAMFSLSVTADNYVRWYERIWVAIKYIFGYPSLSWHDVILDDTSVYNLGKKIEYYNHLKTESLKNGIP